MTTQTDTRVECPTCKKRYKDKNSLKTHRYNMHRGEQVRETTIPGVEITLEPPQTKPEGGNQMATRSEAEIRAEAKAEAKRELEQESEQKQWRGKVDQQLEDMRKELHDFCQLNPDSPLCKFGDQRWASPKQDEHPSSEDAYALFSGNFKHAASCPTCQDALGRSLQAEGYIHTSGIESFLANQGKVVSEAKEEPEPAPTPPTEQPKEEERTWGRRSE